MKADNQHGQHIGYIRVSSVDQNDARQLDGIELDRTFRDKCSGGTQDRPALQQMLEHVRTGDTLHVHEISRLARNLADLLTLVKDLTANGVAVKFHKENLEFTGAAHPMQELMLSMLGSVAQFERSMIRERQAEGIAKAKTEGKYKGRKASVDRQAVADALAADTPIRKIAADLCINPSTVQRIKKELPAAQR